MLPVGHRDPRGGARDISHCIVATIRERAARPFSWSYGACDIVVLKDRYAQLRSCFQFWRQRLAVSFRRLACLNAAL